LQNCWEIFLFPELQISFAYLGNFGLGYSKQTKDEIQEEKKKCIEEKYQKLHKEDPIKFIRDAYFECHESLKSKTRQVVSLMFGEGHEYIQKLFTKEEGWSLSDTSKSTKIPEKWS